MDDTYVAAENAEMPCPDDGAPEPLRGLMRQARKEGATDVHIDPVPQGTLVRFRVDGILHVRETLSPEAGRRLQNQIRIAAGLDTEALFEPVEAKMRWRNSDSESTVDVRVLVIPTGDREATHLRVLYPPEKLQDIEALGFSKEHLAEALAVLRAGTGMVLVSGQTGTGKTTTLYALASALDLEAAVAVSIEDPVEFDIPLIRQLCANTDRGLTMVSGLRSLLRADPDVILVGEIRDQASAIAAARAALAGRLVLASIHALDAASAIEAFHYLSVPYHILGGCLRLVIAQNLVRRVCGACAGSRPPGAEERALFERAGLSPPRGVPVPGECEACHGYGYAGRIGVFEMAPVRGALAQQIAAGTTLPLLRQQCREAGARSMLMDGLDKVNAGVTTMEEIAQFAWPDDQEQKATS